MCKPRVVCATKVLVLLIKSESQLTRRIAQSESMHHNYHWQSCGELLELSSHQKFALLFQELAKPKGDPKRMSRAA